MEIQYFHFVYYTRHLNVDYLHTLRLNSRMSTSLKSSNFSVTYWTEPWMHYSKTWLQTWLGFYMILDLLFIGPEIKAHTSIRQLRALRILNYFIKGFKILFDEQLVWPETERFIPKNVFQKCIWDMLWFSRQWIRQGEFKIGIMQIY